MPLSAAVTCTSEQSGALNAIAEIISLQAPPWLIAASAE